MRLRLRALVIRVMTSSGLFGLRLSFDDGLVVIRAGNSSGKSTAIQAIVYALGLEGMFTASHAVPLQYAVKDRLEYDGSEIPVLGSEVALEIANGREESITLQRAIRSEHQSTNLITVWDGPALTGSNASISRSPFYVRLEGAAQRERGFHSMLADFLEWKLPEVARFDGTVCPLYLECIFPLLIVEQKQGWAGIQARMPLHFRIRDMGKRAIEFVLRLDAYENAFRRQALHEREAAVRTRWTRVVAECRDSASKHGGLMRDVPESPAADWPPLKEPTVLLARNNSWLLLKSAVESDMGALHRLESEEIPRIEQVAGQLNEDLRHAAQALSVAEMSAAELRREVVEEKANLDAATQRLATLYSDLKRNQDVLRLRKLGAVPPCQH